MVILPTAMKEMPIAVNTESANSQHYEVPTEFYQLVLGKRLKYRCTSSHAFFVTVRNCGHMKHEIEFKSTLDWADL